MRFENRRDIWIIAFVIVANTAAQTVRPRRRCSEGNLIWLIVTACWPRLTSSGDKTGITDILSLRGWTIGVTDFASPYKSLYEIIPPKHGPDPDEDGEWKQYPQELLSMAVEKGDTQVYVAGDPNVYYLVKNSNVSHRMRAMISPSPITTTDTPTDANGSRSSGDIQRSSGKPLGSALRDWRLPDPPGGAVSGGGFRSVLQRPRAA